MAKKTVKETKPKKSTKKSVEFKGEVTEFDLFTGLPIEEDTEDKKAIINSFKPKKYTAFDIIKSMAHTIEQNGNVTITYPSFSYYTKEMVENNFFMLNRTLAIKYPLQAQAFNLGNINKYEAACIWNRFIGRYETQGKVPAFLYTKTVKNNGSNSSTHNIAEIDKDLLAAYCRRYSLSLKDVKDMFFFFPNETYDDIERYRIMNDEKEQAKRFLQKEKTKK